jgi:hypothetical protein
MDTVTSVITIFVITSVLNGWFLDFLVGKIESDSSVRNLLIALPILTLALWGTTEIINIIQPGNDYIEAGDLPAFEWIESNTNPASKFLINTYEFPFLPGWVVGLDAGYWLPLLTARDTTVPPMIYTLERSSNPELVRYLKEYNQIQFDIGSRESLQFLSENHFNYVYCSGERGYLDPAELQLTPGFQLAYANGGVQIFEIETD